MTTSPSDRPARTSVPLTFTSLSRATSCSTTRTDVICPRRTTAPAGTVNARRGAAPKCARPNVPERNPAVSGSVILTRYARASASTARPMSDTVPFSVIVAPPVPESSETGTSCAARDLSDTRLVHSDVEPEAARILQAKQRRAGRGHVARLDHLLGHHAVEGRRDTCERRRRRRTFGGGACAVHERDSALRPGRRAGCTRFGRAQGTGGVVELLGGGRPLGLQTDDAFVRRARQGQGSLGRLLVRGRGGDALIGGQRRCASASRVSREVGAIEDDQRLTRTDAIARRHANLQDRCLNARHDRGGGSRLDDAAGFKRGGHVGHRHSRHGDGDWCFGGRACGVRLARTARQDEAGDHSDRARTT